MRDYAARDDFDDGLFLHVFAFGHSCVCPGIFLFHVLSVGLNELQNVDADSAAKSLE